MLLFAFAITLLLCILKRRRSSTRRLANNKVIDFDNDQSITLQEDCNRDSEVSIVDER